MADDEMLINFDLGSAPFISKATFKGGSWKDKRSARKALESSKQRPSNRFEGRNGQSKFESRNAEEVGISVNHRAPKRAKIDAGGSKTSGKPSDPTRVANGHHDSQPRQVVASLFTYNPKSTMPTPMKTVNENEDETTAEPSNAPLDSKLHKFTSLGLSVQLADHLQRKMAIDAPTAIQKAALPRLVKENVDAFVQAQTGSGKTLAYLLPIVQRIMSLSSTPLASSNKDGNTSVHRDSGLFAIILAPTRELSKQISVVLESVLRCAHWIVSGTVSGGEKKKSEKARLRKGLNILIATPGRLADHLEHTEALNVSEVRWLVLDEGDRLMELGFEEDLRKIISKLDERQKARRHRQETADLPSGRVNVLCSATMKMDVQKLGEMSLKDAIYIKSEAAEDETPKTADSDNFSAPAQLQQSYAVVPAKQRLVALVALLKRTFARRGSVMKALVFVACADSVDFHFDVLTSTSSSLFAPETTFASSPHLNFPTHKTTAFRLHGSLPQHQRTSTLSAFRNTTDPAVLICTDVAARGLDLPNVDLVIEFDPPFSPADHLHRIGRTARAGKAGRALIFLQPGPEEGYVAVLREHLGKDLVRDLTRHDSEDILRRGFRDNKEWETRATDWQLEIERNLLESPSRLDLARQAFQAHVRAYATHSATERKWFDMGSLHLGHLAKAFGLRDKPGNIRAPGLSRGKKNDPSSRRDGRKQLNPSTQKNRTEETPQDAEVDTDSTRRKMRSMARQLASGSSEFNLG